MRNLLFGFILLASSVSWATGVDCKDDKNFPNITKVDLKKVISKKGATIIDVNSADSFKKSRIPGAVHFAANQKDLSKVLPQDKNSPIIAYCGGKMCTAWKKAAETACKMGYKNIRHFKAGIRGWKKTS